MISRALVLKDLEKVKRLHEQYYSEFDFPEFFRMLNAFVIEDDKGEIIMAGGIEGVAESVLVTDKSKSNITIGRALIEAQLISVWTCKKYGIRELYAFVNNDSYAKHLIQHGFSPHGLTTLSMKVPNNG